MRSQGRGQIILAPTAASGAFGCSAFLAVGLGDQHFDAMVNCPPQRNCQDPNFGNRVLVEIEDNLLELVRDLIDSDDEAKGALLKVRLNGCSKVLLFPIRPKWAEAFDDRGGARRHRIVQLRVRKGLEHGSVGKDLPDYAATDLRVGRELAFAQRDFTVRLDDQHVYKASRPQSDLSGGHGALIIDPR